MSSKLPILLLVLAPPVCAPADFCIVSHMRSDDSVLRTNEDSMPWATRRLVDVLPHIDGITYAAYTPKSQCAHYLVAEFHKPTESGNALYLRIRAGEQLKHTPNTIADLEIPLGVGSKLGKDQKIDSAAWHAIVDGPVGHGLSENSRRVQEGLLEELKFEGAIQAYCSDIAPARDQAPNLIPNCVVLPLEWEKRRGLAASRFRIDAFPEAAFQQVHLIAEAASRCLKYWEVPKDVQPYDAIPVVLQHRIIGDEKQLVASSADAALPWRAASFRVYQYQRLSGTLCGPLPEVRPERVSPR